MSQFFKNLGVDTLSHTHGRKLSLHFFSVLKKRTLILVVLPATIQSVLHDTRTLTRTRRDVTKREQHVAREAQRPRRVLKECSWRFLPLRDSVWIHFSDNPPLFFFYFTLVFFVSVAVCQSISVGSCKWGGRWFFCFSFWRICTFWRWKEIVLYMRPLNPHSLNHIIPFCVIFFFVVLFLFFLIYPKMSGIWLSGLKNIKSFY